MRIDANSNTNNSSSRTINQIPITSSIALELIVKPTFEAEFYSIPLEEAKSLPEENQTTASTYLAEINPDQYFGFRITNQCIRSSERIGCTVTIDDIPISTGQWWVINLSEPESRVTSFERNQLFYPLQFSKSKILQDPSELKHSIRTDLSHVGKIVFRFSMVEFVGTVPNTRTLDSVSNQFEETIKIKESQSKDKGVCVTGSKPIESRANYKELRSFRTVGDVIKEVILLYRDPIGMISEKRRRNMLSQPSIRHSNITLEVPEEEEEEPSLKKVKRESKVIDLDNKVINLDDSDDEEEKQKIIKSKIKREASDEMKRVLSWNIHQVQEWLHSIDSSFVNSEVSKQFKEQEISGRVLFTLKEEDLKSLGCDTIGKRRLVLNEIEKLKNS